MRRRILTITSLALVMVFLATAAFLAISRAGGLAGVQWKQIGPAPLQIDAETNFQGNGPDSGQTVDVAIDPRGSTDLNIYVATDDGGIWQSQDGGKTWRTLASVGFEPLLELDQEFVEVADGVLLDAARGIALVVETGEFAADLVDVL